MFDVAVAPGETSDLRVYLRAGARCLTETWTFPWTGPALQNAPQTIARGRQDALDLHAATLSQQPIRN